MTVVGVTGFHSTDNPSPGLAIARCLLAGGHQVVAFDYSPFSTGLHYDAITRIVIADKFGGNGKTYASNFAKLASHANVEMIIPSIDMEVTLFSRYLTEFEAYGIRVLVPAHEQLDRASKVSLADLAMKCGVNYPKTAICSSLEEVSRCCTEIGFPCMLKSSVYEANLVSKSEDVPYYVDQLVELWGWPILVQEFVSGEELGVAALSGPDGTLVRAVQMKKIGLTNRGKTWAGVTIYDEEVADTVVRILTAMRWTGACEIEFMRSPEHRLHLFEINPRFPAWVFLTCLADANLPAMAAEMADRASTKDAPFDYRTGVAFVRIATDVEAPLSKIVQLQLEGEWRNDRTTASK